MRALARLSELTRVRLAARGGALALALLVGLIAGQSAIPGGGPNPDAAPAISVTMVASEQSRSRPPVVRLRQASDGASRPAPAGDSGGGGQVTVWLDGAAGRVVFDNSEHYMRCLEASLAHVDEPGCPHRATRQVLARADED